MLFISGEDTPRIYQAMSHLYERVSSDLHFPMLSLASLNEFHLHKPTDEASDQWAPPGGLSRAERTPFSTYRSGISWDCQCQREQEYSVLLIL